MTTANDDVTPVRKQYLDVKRQYPSTIVFFRLGDFYETFDDDAELVARELDIVLTSRPVGKGVRVPLAGIPYHAVENYLARLIEKGYHVAICEQVGTQPVNGIFPRQVTRVVTPGTVSEPGLLPGDANNYLAAILVEDNHAALAYVDITTGEFAVTEIFDNPQTVLRAELTRLGPAEVLHPENCAPPEGTPGHRTVYEAWRFEFGRCRQVLLDHFKVAALDGFGLRDLPLAVRTAGAVLQYLKQTQSAALNLLTHVSVYHIGEFMTLDAATRRNLELTETLRGEAKGSLLHVLDATVTPMGKRLMRQWVSKPLLNLQTILARQQGITFFFERGLLRNEIRTALKPLADVERLTGRILSGSAQPRDLVALRNSLAHLPGLLAYFTRENVAPPFVLPHSCKDVLTLLQTALADEPPATLQNSGIIRPGYAPELDDNIERSRHAREWIANLEQVERERTGIKSLKVGYNKVFGYYIEVTRTHSQVVPSEYIRKQTLVNAERYITPEMKEYETLVLNAEERIHELETRLFRELCVKLEKWARLLMESAKALAEMDVFAALAQVAANNGYVCPQVVAEPVFEVFEGRHPVVEQTLRAERYVPNDIVFEPGEVVRIITGPNMSGKSTVLRQAALLVLLAQMGSYVPARAATIGLVDRIFTRIGAQDEIHAGQSTFMVEMIETANILNHATARSLLILDEIGRGTSTYDGLSIAWAVVEYIHNHPRLRAKTLFATHYHELTQLADLLPGVRNYNVAVSEVENKVVFLHKIVPGGADRSYGIHVAQLAGLPGTVIQRAGEILQQLEASSGRAVNINPNLPRQMVLFPETNPLLDELKALDLNTLSPIEALNRLFEWQRKFLAK